MKRMLSLVLVLALLFALEIPVFAGDAGLQNFSPATAYVPFSDVPADAWYAENVKTVCEYGLMQGKGQGKFMPSGKLSVAETLAIACRLHNIFQGGDGVIGTKRPFSVRAAKPSATAIVPAIIAIHKTKPPYALSAAYGGFCIVCQNEKDRLHTPLPIMSSGGFG